MPLENISKTDFRDYAVIGTDARTRYMAGDATLSATEGEAILSLAAELKAAGIPSAIDVLLDVAANPRAWRGAMDFASGEQPAGSVG